MNKTALIVSALCGLVGFVLLSRHKQQFEAEASGGAPVPVVVARADIALGTTIEEDMVAMRDLPASYVEDRHIRADQLQKVLGVRASLGVRAGESLLWTDLASGQVERRDLSGLVLEGMRAVTITATGESTLGGLLRPGDRVDVLMTSGDEGTERATRPLVQNLLVLAVGEDTGRRGHGDDAFGLSSFIGPREITLSGTIAQAQAIVHANTVADLSVVLRNPGDVSVTRQPPATSDSDLRSEAVLERVQGQRSKKKDAPSLPEAIDED